MKILPNSSFMRAVIAVLAILTFAGAAQATPYASCITNSGTGGTNVSFYLNESGGTVTITYEDGTTNANWNGITTGTNVPAGLTNFSLIGHTSYTLTVFKIGTGAPSVIKSFGAGTPRGVDVNKNPTSPYFGRVYLVNGGTGVFLLNSDLSATRTNTVLTGGVTWGQGGTGPGTSPYRLAINADDYLTVGDASLNGSAVWRIDGNFTTNQLFLGPVGSNAGSNAMVHGTIESRPLLIGTTNAGNAVLMEVDGEIPGAPPNSLMIFDINSGPLPWTNSPIFGPVIGVGVDSIGLGGNEYPGLTQGPDGKIYASTYRNNLSNPLIQIYDSTGTNQIWNSWIPTGTTSPTGDYFLQTVSGLLQGIVDSAPSPEGNYLVGISIDNWFVITPLTNGIPDVSRLFVVNPTSFTGNGRGVCWDVADNIYLSSSGIGAVQEWTLGGTSTAITTGTTTGTTGFKLLSPDNTVTVGATNLDGSAGNMASQGGVNGTPGTPVPGTFTITRSSTNGYALPLGVSFSLTGTATNGVYTVTTTGTGASITPGAALNSVTIPAGVQSITLSIIPTTNNVPRLTNTVILTLLPGGSYSTPQPNFDVVNIQNTSSQEILLTALSPTMYKAFSNDIATFVVTRFGDISAPSYTVSSSSFTFSGTAVAGVDFTLPASITFNPGDVKYTNSISPLVGGQPPVHTNKPVFSGNLTAIIGVAGGAGYSAFTNKVTVTSIDDTVAAATVLWSTPLTDPNESNTWHVTYGSANMVNVDTNDYEVTFGYDLTANSGIDGGIGLPPNGATTCLRITVNKEALNPGASAGVDAFPIGVTFSNNYAVRFNMNIVQGSSTGKATEGPIFGIDHGSRGYATNWWVGDGIVSNPVGLPSWTADGIWYWIDGAAGGAGAGDYIEFTSVSNAFPNTGWTMVSTKTFASFTNNFKNPAPFSAGVITGVTAAGTSGIPANETGFNTGSNASAWSDVEIKQINGVVTLSIDKTTIFTYTNTTIWTNGAPMLGFNDPFVSVQSEDGAAYYSNLRVVQIGNPKITQIALAPVGAPPTSTNVVINFTTTDGDDTIASFNLLSSNPTNSVVGTIDTATAATFTQLGLGAFQATTAKPTNSMRYFRIQHK